REASSVATITVSTVAGLVSALSSAHAGDSILLAPGTYAGISISNTKIAGGAVTITSQSSANPAVLTGLQVSGSSGLDLVGLDVASSANSSYYATVPAPNNVTFSNMLFEGANATASNDAAGLHLTSSTNVSVTNSTFTQLGGTGGGNALALSNDDQVTVSGNA